MVCFFKQREQESGERGGGSVGVLILCVTLCTPVVKKEVVSALDSYVFLSTTGDAEVRRGQYGRGLRPTHGKSASLLGCHLSVLLFSLCNIWQYRFVVWIIFLNKESRRAARVGAE